MNEITLDINFRQALILKHGIEQMINIKEDRLDQLIFKDGKTQDDSKEIYKIRKDVYEERDALKIVNESLDKFHNERRMEVAKYAANLPELLEEAERNNRR